MADLRVGLEAPLSHKLSLGIASRLPATRFPGQKLPCLPCVKTNKMMMLMCAKILLMTVVCHPQNPLVSRCGAEQTHLMIEQIIFHYLTIILSLYQYVEVKQNCTTFSHPP